MKMLRAALFAVTIATLVALQIPAAAAPQAAPAPPGAMSSCDNLASVALPHATINSAEPVAAGAFVAPNAGRGGAGGRAGRGGGPPVNPYANVPALDRKSTRLNSSHLGISYAVFCLKKKNDLSSCLQGSIQF